ncbi:hypothetical protein GCM10028819_33070 [Spirosoma humi]
MICRFISKEDSIIDKVVTLGIKYSKTLGFMPEGGFQDHAKKGLIAVATEGDDLWGYILFRIGTKTHKITIVHLCVDKPYRRRGVSEALINFVRAKYERSLDGIVLSCRRDYKEATKFWERYGFKVVSYQSSKSQQERQLVKWYYSFGNRNLFNDTYYSINQKELSVSLDTNIIIKYSDISEFEDTPYTAETLEVKALFADWISAEVRYFYASETNNEINRNENWQDVLRSRNVLSKLTRIEADVITIRKKEEDLRDIIRGYSQNDRSDRRQIAECIAANTEFFLTLDNGILDKSDELYEKYKISVYRPAEFILHLDKILNESQYHPSRLAGARHEEGKALSSELEELTEYFIYHKESEKKAELKKLVYSIASDVKNSIINTVKDPNGKPIAFWGYTQTAELIDVRLIRVKGDLSSTLIKQLLSNIIRLAVNNKIQIIQITDKFLSEEITTQLLEFGFFLKSQIWIKIALPGLLSVYDIHNVCTSVELHAELNTILNKYELASDTLSKADMLYTIERALYPVKFKELDIPTYIVPIKAYWASQLFEHFLADSTIYGSRPEISWNRENAYYRSPAPGGEKAVGRILWYVSYDEKFPHRSKAITACSYLDEVVIDSAKKAYNRFKKYGTYEWRDILSTAKGDAFNKIKVLKFSDTELFKKPVKLIYLKSLLGQGHSFVSPLKISNEFFHKIYLCGKS